MKRKKKRVFRHVSLSHEAIGIAQKNRCWICGRFMNKDASTKETRNHPLYRTLDHIVPLNVIRKVSKGGYILENNKLFAHKECNMRRGDNTISVAQFTKVRYTLIGAVAYKLSLETTNWKGAR